MNSLCRALSRLFTKNITYCIVLELSIVVIVVVILFDCTRNATHEIAIFSLVHCEIHLFIFRQREIFFFLPRKRFIYE